MDKRICFCNRFKNYSTLTDMVEFCIMWYEIIYLFFCFLCEFKPLVYRVPTSYQSAWISSCQYLLSISLHLFCPLYVRQRQLIFRTYLSISFFLPGSRNIRMGDSFLPYPLKVDYMYIKLDASTVTAGHS